MEISVRTCKDNRYLIKPISLYLPSARCYQVEANGKTYRTFPIKQGDTISIWIESIHEMLRSKFLQRDVISQIIGPQKTHLRTRSHMNGNNVYTNSEDVHLLIDIITVTSDKISYTIHSYGELVM